MNSDDLRKRGARCKKSKGDHYLMCQKKVAKAVLVYESKVVTKKILRFPNFFPKSWCSLKKKKVFTSNSSPLSQFFPQNHGVLHFPL